MYVCTVCVQVCACRYIRTYIPTYIHIFVCTHVHQFDFFAMSGLNVTRINVYLSICLKSTVRMCVFVRICRQTVNLILRVINLRAAKWEQATSNKEKGAVSQPSMVCTYVLLCV